MKTGNGGVYSRVKNKYPNSTRSFLRLETALGANGGTIQFKIRQDNGVPNFTETRLKPTDSFIITAMSLCIMKVASAAAVPTDNEFAAAIVRSYPSPIIFANGTEAANLMAIYNSKTIFKINKTEVIPGVENLRFYRAPSTQQGTGPAVIQQRDQWDGATFTYVNMTPSVTISGQDDVEISIPTPSLSFAGAANTINYAVVRFDGLLVPGASLTKKDIWSKSE